MKITIDDKICHKHKLALEEFLMALMYRQLKDVSSVYNNLINREVIVQKGSDILVTQRWSDVMDEILAESGGCTKSEEELKELAKKMIDAYPHGAMIDKRTGRPTTYYFQCNNYEVRSKLKAFYSRYGEDYSDDDILDAEKRYVARWNGNYQQIGFRQLKYFIFKKDKETGEITSPLLDFLENKENEGEEINTSDDWMVSVRN